MEQHTLTRQERGKLAEHLVRGLHTELGEPVMETLNAHTEQHYADWIGTCHLRYYVSEINEYRWTDLLRVPIPDDISWRPDIIIEVRWKRQYRSHEVPGQSFWDRELPPYSIWVPRLAYRDRPVQHWNCLFRVYYPIEVKSGAKKTLTEQQSAAIPRVAENVDYVHPVIASVDIDDLPKQYLIEVDTFTDSAWAGSDSRYRS
jgi:hypothetical protein